MNKFVLFLAVLAVLALSPQARAQTRTLVVADFNKGNRTTNLGEDIGTWDGFPNDPTQSCKMAYAVDDALAKSGGKSLQLDYDVDSPNPAYNGFWLKIQQAEVVDLDTLSFYVKGDSKKGFTSKIKIEIKDKKHGKSTFFVEHITDQWQKISLTLDPRSLDPKQRRPFEEFVIVFDDVNSRPKTGRLLVDQIEFSKSQ
jgi:hypothetical protein